MSEGNRAGVGVSLIVRKQKDFLARLYILGVFAIWIAFILVVYKLAGFIGIFVGVFLVIPVALIVRYITVKFIKVEHEYVFSSGIFEITKIENQAVRVPVVRVPVDDIIEFGRVADTGAEEKRKACKKCYFAGVSDEQETSYYFTCDVNNTGEEMYVFDPDDRILNALKRYSPMIEKAARR
ncbi:MAG: hypothetical protein E7388_01460 [Ruminococcaceae bacterium]|nr:hypothetical protein [Oscillospiraceae bacterium]